MNQRSQTASAFFWSFVERIGSQILRSVFAIVLARLLLPRDFGMVAVLFLFTGVAEVIMTSGFGTALIRKQTLSRTDECSMFYFNIVAGAFMAAALFCALPYVASFYRLPQLILIGRAAAFGVLINSLGIVPGSLLVRRLNFLTLCKVSIASISISGVVGILMAWKGFGVWSIVCQQLVASLAAVILIWALGNWRPSAVFSFHSIRNVFGFSVSFASIGLLDVIARNLSTAIIGRRFTAAEVGFYSRAVQIEEFPVLTAYFAVSRPSLSLFAAFQDREADLAIRVRSVLTYLAMVNFPVMVALAVAAKPLVSVLLTAKWLACVPLLQLLCAVGIFFPLQRINLNVIVAKGNSSLFLRLELLRTFLAMVCISIAGFFGIKLMIAGQIVAMAVTWCANSISVGRLTSYTFARQARDVLPYALASTLMAAGMSLAGRLPLGGDKSLLAAQLIMGSCVYVTLCATFRLSAFLQLRGFAKTELARLRLWASA
jgi:teichuronic acid exporter